MRIGDSYDVRWLESVDDDPVHVVQIENRTLGVRARGRPSRDPEEAERTAWAAIATAEAEL